MERAKGLVFEDAIPGVQAGKRAGMKGESLLGCECTRSSRALPCTPVVWVPDPDLVAVGDQGTAVLSVLEQPDLTLNSVEDFVPENWGLPPYDS